MVTTNLPRDDDPSGTPSLVGVEIRNIGPNTAKRPGCWVAAKGYLLRAEYMGDGFLEPDTPIDIVTPIVGPVDDGEVHAMFWCRDHRELLHVWTHRGQHKVYPPRFRQEPWKVSVAYSDMWSSLFPDVPVADFTTLDDSPGRWLKRRETNHAPVNFNETSLARWPAGTPISRRLRLALRAAMRALRYPETLPPPPRERAPSAVDVAADTE